MILLNVHPYTVGHLQVVPQAHLTTFRELLGQRLMGQVNDAIEKCMVLLSKAYSPDGFNIGLNLGRAAGNSIDHLHYHIVPRYASREVHGFMETCADSKVFGEDIDEVLAKLKECARGILAEGGG